MTYETTGTLYGVLVVVMDSLPDLELAVGMYPCQVAGGGRTQGRGRDRMNFHQTPDWGHKVTQQQYRNNYISSTMHIKGIETMHQ
jgi:hypothetical protein